MQKVRFGIVGIGNMGTAHCKSLLEGKITNGVLTAICEPKKAKADAKKNWDEAHMTPSERSEKVQNEHDRRIAEAKERTERANERYEAAKKK